MKKFKIFFGLGGGAKDSLIIDAIDHDTATDAAYDRAVEYYEMFEGLHGLFNIEEELEEDPDLMEEDLEEMRQEDIDSWVDYRAEEVK